MAQNYLVVALTALWSLVCWLQLHSGLALILDKQTGAKYCVSLLSRYLGLRQGGSLELLLAIALPVLWLGLPLLIAGLFLLPWLRRSRAGSK